MVGSLPLLVPKPYPVNKHSEVFGGMIFGYFYFCFELNVFGLTLNVARKLCTQS